MQKWEYAQLYAYFYGDDKKRDFHVRYFGVSGKDLETPPKVKKGRDEVLPPSSECWSWFNSKITQLGQEGWEMISAPTLGIFYAGHGGSYEDKWILWFKRPSP